MRRFDLFRIQMTVYCYSVNIYCALCAISGVVMGAFEVNRQLHESTFAIYSKESKLGRVIANS